MLFSRFNRITVSLFAFAWMCLPASAQTATPSTSATAPAPAPSGPKKRVAVLNFDYGTVKTEVIQLFGSDQDVGKGISDLLVQKLVQDGQFSVIER
ncbi:MAG TPA: CsgG/HfaB family protein, partial [Verrucomicrobiae bacterium]|nr:CsgG/HfaB family protein [Verrucomicrobiae bacterium]